MRISIEPYGLTPDGGEILNYTLENNNAMRVEILNYGGIIRSILVPDRSGQIADIVLGHNAPVDYLHNPGYFGAVVGRNCNRISNAIAPISGTKWPLEQNDGTHNLHSGSGGLSYCLFSSEVYTFNNLPVLFLHYKMPDGFDGFPGELSVHIIYALTDDNALMIDYRAVCEQDTVINLTNHSYFNLAGHNSGSVWDHILELDAPFYTPTRPDLIPTGEILSVKDTPFDFTTAKPIGKDLEDEALQVLGGYDHNFVLSGNGYRKVAKAIEPQSGRVMEVFTDLPGMQLYTGNGIDPEPIYKNGIQYNKHQGFCLETQFFPNAVNIPWFPSSVFAGGEEYASTTTFQFSIV